MAWRGGAGVCGAFGLLLEWSPFEQWEGTPFVDIGRWNAIQVEWGLVTMMSCWWLVWMFLSWGTGGCRGAGYIDAVQYHSPGTG